VSAEGFALFGIAGLFLAFGALMVVCMLGEP
jgi:hypothetical protein